jgi:hypothetical protein
VNHIPLALLIQLCSVPTFGWWVGAAAGAWMFVGREYAQAEYRLIEHYYGGRRANLPPFAPLHDLRAWNTKSMLDWIAPAVVVCVLAQYFEPIFQG